MATKIIHQPTEFKPVKIEMEFTTRQQIAAFIQVMYYPDTVAKAVYMKCPFTKQAELMSDTSLGHAIDELITTEVIDELIKLADA